MKSGVAMLALDKIDFKIRVYYQRYKSTFYKDKGSIYQEDVF